MTSILFVIAAAAFEPQRESPWLSGGAAAALFPRSHLSLCVNPASIGLLEETAFSVSASRPFGFTELDRTAVAGGSASETFAAGGYASCSGRNGYLETTVTGAGAFTLSRGVVAGASVSWHRISIEGFGGSNALSSDIGVIARPLQGIFLGGSVRGLASSSPAGDGMGAVPRTVSASLGVCPVQGVTLSAASSMHQYAGEEYSFVTSVEPYPGVSLSASMLTPPVRMGFALQVSISLASVQYGYSTHTDLPSGHAISLIYGTSGFKPEPLAFGREPDEEEQVSFPINVNTATEVQLIQVPGIGPSTASTIRNYILSNGPLDSVDELIDVPGIGPATLENLKHYLTV